MAYLKPMIMTCPQCDFRSEVTWIIGVGPGSRPGKAPYRKLRNSGAFLRPSDEDKTLQCPQCGHSIS